jgi:RIO kinase 1
VRVPEGLHSLVDAGIIEEVLRPLLSGKEAEVFLVMAGGHERVAKVYKQAHLRSFKNRADYTEGRTGRNSRDRRAIAKRSRYGRERDEAAWHSAEVDAIHKLWAAGVRVPEPYNYMDGVLVMELVQSASGAPAPRLGELVLSPARAQEVFDLLLREVVKMLCAGVVHADLSDFNILMSSTGPVIIDFPQAVDAASNGAAKRLLARDIDNLQRFLARFVPGRSRPYAEELWTLYESGQLTAETRLRGEVERPRKQVEPPRKRDEIQEMLARIDAPRRPRPPAAARGRWVEVKIDPRASRAGRSQVPDRLLLRGRLPRVRLHDGSGTGARRALQPSRPKAAPHAGQGQGRNLRIYGGRPVSPGNFRSEAAAQRASRAEAARRVWRSEIPVCRRQVEAPGHEAHVQEVRKIGN